MDKIKYLLVAASLAGLAASCNNNTSQPNPVPKKSSLSAEQIAQRYLEGFKYEDYKAAYSYTCKDFQNKILQERYIKSWTQAVADINKNQQIYYKDFQLKEIITENGETKARIMTIANSPITGQTSEMPGQLLLKQENEQWCVYPDVGQFQ